MMSTVEDPYTCEAVEISYRIEPIELCERCGFLMGSALKYLFRYKHTENPLQDLKKAKYYLQRYIDKRDEKGINTFEVSKSDPLYLAFLDKEFFKYVNRNYGIDLNAEHIMDWVDEKIEEMELDEKLV